MQDRKNEKTHIIALRGGYGFGNFGDDALMVAAYEIVRRVFPDQSLILKCSQSSYVRNIIPELTVMTPNDGILSPEDISVFGGGTQFFSFPLSNISNKPSIFKRFLKSVRSPRKLGVQLHRKICESLFFKTRGIVAGIGLGFGPFEKNSIEEQVTQSLIRKMCYLSVRDKSSYELCQKWGCSIAVLRSDLCYLPNLWKVHKHDIHSVVSHKHIRKVGVIIRDWPHTHEGDSYDNPLFKVVKILRSTNKQVVFISFALQTDREWVKKLNILNEPLVGWRPEIESIESFLKHLVSYDAFITTRYHGAVFGSILGKPVVCVEIEPKLQLVAELLKGGAQLWRYPFEVEECVQHIENLDNNYACSVKQLEDIVRSQSVLANRIIEEMRLKFAS